MDIGNKQIAEEVLRELEHAMYDGYIVGNAEIAKCVEDLRDALKKAE